MLQFGHIYITIAVAYWMTFLGPPLLESTVITVLCDARCADIRPAANPVSLFSSHGAMLSLCRRHTYITLAVYEITRVS